MPFSSDWPDLLAEVRRLSAKAAMAILEIYQNDFSVAYKSDETPVTEADYESHSIIKRGLALLTPEIPFLSEESADLPYAERRRWRRYWLVDPLDGTREFINRRDDFTINVALIDEGKAVLGLVEAPARRVCYSAVSGLGAYKHLPDQAARRLQARKDHHGRPVVALSLSHASKKTEAFINRLGSYELLRRGSIIKCCLIAEGKADLYPRFGKTGEWDTAAGQCVLEEAGGFLTNFHNRPLRYNRKPSLINPPFIAYSPAADGWQSRLNADDAERGGR